MDALFFLFVIVVGSACFCGCAAASIASSRGEHAGGFFLFGLIGGPFGILAACTSGKKCPHCFSRIHIKARVCPRCQREIPAEAGQ